MPTWPCQQRSRNLGPAFSLNLVNVYSDSSERLDPSELRDADGARAGQLQRLQGDPPVRHLAAPLRQGAVLRTGQTSERTSAVSIPQSKESVHYAILQNEEL